LRGRYHLSKLDQESYRTAIEAFNTAIRQDAGYAEAWAGLSETYYYISSVYLPSAEAMPRARAAAQKAIELDEGLAQAHASLGVVAAWYDWDWASAEREFRRAIELNPSDAAAHFFLGELLAANQRTTEASREYSRAVELDPLSDYVQATWTQPDYLAGRLEPAIARARRLLQLEPGYFPAHTLLGMCFLQQSKSGEAFSELRRAISLADNPSFPLAILGYGLGIAGRRPEARAVLDTLTLLSARAHVPAYSIAAVYVGLGERDSAFEWLGRSLHDHDEDLAFLAVDPIMKTLRTDARYHELLRAMRLKG
jgi:serine/threonine-protein kinase